MNSRSLFFARRPVASGWFAPGAGVVAVIAAMTLAACGPRDETPVAGGAPGGTAAVASTVVAQTAPAMEPSPRPSGQPVPSTSGQVAAPAPVPAYAPLPQVAPAPAYAAAPAATYPADPAPRGRLEPVQAPVAQTPAASNRVGSIASIAPIRTRPKGSGAGAVIGGVLGGVVGNQFGHGLGRAALTGAGAVGGALAGNNVERNYKEGVSGYRVVVRLDNGHTRTFTRTRIGDLHVGDRVQLDANSFHRG
jgi:outer membrane lipoprotein SlyB